MKPEYIMLFYILATMTIGLVLAKTNKTVQDMFVAKRGLGICFIIALVLAETIGGSGTVGNTAEAMTLGMSASWATWGLALGCTMFIIVFGKFYRVLGTTRGIMSVPAAYEIIFDQKTKIVLLIIVSFVYAMLFALQPVAAAAILAPMFGIDMKLTIVVIGIIFILIAAFGGLRGLAWMNVIHAFVMFFGLMIVAYIAMKTVGGFEELTISAPAEYFSLLQPSTLTVVLWVVGTILSQMSSAVMTSITLGGKTLATVKRGVLIGAIIMAVFAFFPPFLGVVAHAAMPDIVPKTALYTLANSFGPYVGGLASMAVVAAIFSTGPALLLVVTTTVTQDLFKGLVCKQATEKQVMLFARIATVVIGLVVVYCSTKTTSIFAQTLGAFQIRAIAALVLMVALAWPRVNANAAFWSILIGGGVAAGWYFAGNPFGIEPLLPSAVIGLLILIVLSLLSKERVSAGYALYQKLKHEYDEEAAEDDVETKLVS